MCECVSVSVTVTSESDTRQILISIIICGTALSERAELLKQDVPRTSVLQEGSALEVSIGTEWPHSSS